MTSALFQRKSATFFVFRNTDVDCIIIHIFFESLKIVLTKMVAILMMSAKSATISFLKIRYFEIKVMTW